MSVVKIACGLIAMAAIVYGLLWLMSIKQYDVTYGISFSKQHATSLGLDWKEVYKEMLADLKPSVIRISADWDEVEQTQGVFMFDDVDFMMDEAARAGTTVTLAFGQKTPRWPECHIPSWVTSTVTMDMVTPYIRAVVERYKTHEALALWQVENEPFIAFPFGECDLFSKEIVRDEISLVRSLNTDHKIIVTDSGELSDWYRASRAGDVFGTTLYRVVRTPKDTIVRYRWLPAGFYKAKAAVMRIDKDAFFVAELQAEPWFAAGGNPNNTPIAVQEETMSLEQLTHQLWYVERIGASRAYLWGVEWWYLMKHTYGDARYWEFIKEKINPSG